MKPYFNFFILSRNIYKIGYDMYDCIKNFYSNKNVFRPHSFLA